jgi:hypothetical protein
MISRQSCIVASLVLLSSSLAVVAWRQHLDFIVLKAAAQRIRFQAQARQRDMIETERRLEAQLAAAQHDRSVAAEALARALDPKTEKHGQTAVGVVDSWLAAMNDSDTMRLMAIRQKGRIARNYAALFKRLNLTPDQIDQMTNLLLEKKESSMDAAVGAVQQDINPLENPGEFGDMVQAMRDDVEGQIKALLGDAGYEQYQQYNQTQARQNVVNDLQQLLGATDTPLTPDQTRLFQEVLSQGKTNQITDDVLGASQRFLSEPQIKALQSIQQQQQVAAELRKQQQQVLMNIGGTLAGHQ